MKCNRLLVAAILVVPSCNWYANYINGCLFVSFLLPDLWNFESWEFSRQAKAKHARHNGISIRR